MAGLPIRQRATQRQNMDPKIAFLDVGIWPDLCEQLSLADQLARTLDEGVQEIESATADTDGPIPFQQ